MLEQIQEPTVLGKICKKYKFTPVSKSSRMRPGWDPHVGLTIRGSTFIYMVYNDGSGEYQDKLTNYLALEAIVAEFRRCGVAIHE